MTLADNNFVGVDRLGSMRAMQQGNAPVTFSYLPYGEELNATPNDQIKFATYTRDGSTGLDYADQRYFTSTWGRVMSADRLPAHNFIRSGEWNKYSYTRGDPINRADRHGLSSDPEEGDSCYWDPDLEDWVCDDPGPDPDPGGGSNKPPPCPPLPTLPAGIGTDQVAKNVQDSHSFYNQLLSSPFPEGALPALFGYLTAAFQEGGTCDYKAQYQPGTQDYNNAKVFGNFDFGAVLESFGFSYTFTQNAAGMAQILICLSGHSCGTGVPGLQYPFGDQVEDAVDIKKGCDYEKAKDANCK